LCAFVYEIANLILQISITAHEAFSFPTSPYFWVQITDVYRESQFLFVVILVHLIIVILLWIRMSVAGALLMVIAAIISFLFLLSHDWGDAGIWLLLFIPTWAIFPLIFGLPLLIGEMRKR